VEITKSASGQASSGAGLPRMISMQASVSRRCALTLTWREVFRLRRPTKFDHAVFGKIARQIAQIASGFGNDNSFAFTAQYRDDY
jgi:hypothetical protein